MSQLPTYHLKSYPSSIVASGLKRVERHSTAHWHDCCEVELVLSGSGTHFVNGHPHRLGAGDIYMLTTFDHHEIIADEPISVLGIMFDEELVRQELFDRLMAYESIGGELNARLHETEFEQVKSCFEAVIAEEERLKLCGEAEFARLYIGSMLDCILIRLARRLEDEQSLIDSRQIRDAVLYICRHFREPISLSELAGRFYLSESYLSRLFTKATGRSFKSFLIDLRLRSACRLLATTDRSVTDICYECGFGSYSHFMRSFREHYLTSPNGFRKLHSTK